MDIGKEIGTIVIEPVESPVPSEEPAPAPVPTDAPVRVSA